ncbi:hypothetical protein M378DRAFT_922927 [Amanita muscaria Koide BX008]|uniref:Uncharacterized protein n=1 Tax=Amanita muscaria (strain Koide BX008) TaxID=946122 RepID=A0A0C2WFY0_AMAMK|nr:hypothetical protein M378DRAFT_922927 [Amanita muscaria Koide BX008]
MAKHEAAHPVEQGLTEHAGAFGSLTPFISTAAEQTMLERSDLDVCLSLVLVHLQETKLEFPPCAMIIGLMYSLLSFDPVEIALRVRSISDAQVMMDVIDYFIDAVDQQ